jgi:hypothetical protein
LLGPFAALAGAVLLGLGVCAKLGGDRARKEARPNNSSKTIGRRII